MWTCVDLNVCICVLFLISCIDMCACYLVSVPGLHVYRDVNLEYLLSAIFVCVFFNLLCVWILNVFMLLMSSIVVVHKVMRSYFSLR